MEEIRAIAPGLWPECPGSYRQVVQTGLQRMLVSLQQMLKCQFQSSSLTFKTWRAGEHHPTSPRECGREKRPFCFQELVIGGTLPLGSATDFSASLPALAGCTGS